MDLRYVICDSRSTAAPRRRDASSSASRPRLPARRNRTGFSFTEILFAVIILGIGFIMVAAIFPVALQQAKTNTEEVTAASIARGAALGYLNNAFADGDAPKASNTSGAPDPTNTSNCVPAWSSTAKPVVDQLSWTAPAVGGRPSLWDSVRPNLILPQDPRFAWVALYQRGYKTPLVAPPPSSDSWDKYAQIFVFPVETRNATVFDKDADTTLPVGINPPPTGAYVPEANLMAHVVSIVIINDFAPYNGVDLIAFDTSAGDQASLNAEAAVEGAFVVIADDQIATPAADQGLMNGRMYRLGARHAELDGNTIFGLSSSVVYELAPGNDFSVDPGADGAISLTPLPPTSDDIDRIGIDDGSRLKFNGPATAYVIGRSYTSANLAILRNNALTGTTTSLTPPLFDGACMAISGYTTCVQVNNK